MSLARPVLALAAVALAVAAAGGCRRVSHAAVERAPAATTPAATTPATTTPATTTPATPATAAAPAPIATTAAAAAIAARAPAGATRPLACADLEGCVDACRGADEQACAGRCTARLTVAARHYYDKLQACVVPACATPGHGEAPCAASASSFACKMCVMAHCAGLGSACMMH